MDIHLHSFIHSFIHTNTHIHAHMCARTRARRTHTHTHAHVCIICTNKYTTEGLCPGTVTVAENQQKLVQWAVCFSLCLAQLWRGYTCVSWHCYVVKGKDPEVGLFGIRGDND